MCVIVLGTDIYIDKLWYQAWCTRGGYTCKAGVHDSTGVQVYLVPGDEVGSPIFRYMAHIPVMITHNYSFGC